MSYKAFFRVVFSFVLVSLVLAIIMPNESLAAHPKLVLTQQDIKAMRDAIFDSSDRKSVLKNRFANAYKNQKRKVDAILSQPIRVPVPKDGGGGYTHEQHKQNYQAMYRAGVMYQLSQEQQYADYVRAMLLDYAELYPTLDVHPKRKVKSQNPGKLFWQSLNEAMWLVYTIQAYDLVYDALRDKDRQKIEQQLLRPVAVFLSDGQPSTFNKVHNHGTWATAGVGMAGYVLNEPEWVEKALYDLDKSGKGGFLKQLDQLFSPQGYYNEGPYYQRFALLPFVTFAKAIEHNEPSRDIFGYRDHVLLKAIDTTIQLSYNGLFFPINDAIKSKGIDTIELVHGVTVAYSRTQNAGYLDIAKRQDRIVLTGDGLRVAQALDDGKAQPFAFKSVAFGDGSQGEQGALVVMRSQMGSDQALVFKPAAQGLGHGHFDKLTWQFYDKGEEIVSDYGAARFLNVEAKFGGRYLPENTSYAKQTISHNTVVVDEVSHFNGSVRIGNKHWPTLRYFETNPFGSIASADIDTAYENVSLKRTLALLEFESLQRTLVLDLFTVDAQQPHQFDLPLHYQGQLINTNFALQANTNNLPSLGTQNGYQHLWLKGQGAPTGGDAKVTWLNKNGRFYTQTAGVDGQTSKEQFLFTQIGANDPNFNLRNEHSFIRRVKNTSKHHFVSVLEPHGEYNPGQEFTLDAESSLSDLKVTHRENIILVELTLSENRYLVAIQDEQTVVNTPISFEYDSLTFQLDKRFAIYPLRSL